MGEQKIQVTTFIKLDFVDRLKILFGRAIKVETNIVIPQEQEINMFNADSKTEIIASTGEFTKQSHPPFGYIPS